MNNQSWSSNGNAARASGGTLNKMISSTSDDGGYDMDERGMMMTIPGPASSSGIDGGGTLPGASFAAQYGGSGEEMQLASPGEAGDGGSGMLFCQPVMGDNDGAGARTGTGGAIRGNSKNNLPTFQEVDMEDDDDDDDEDDDNGHHNPHGHDMMGQEEGSDISSADKYADRNSDPGIHVHAEADYALPIMPGHHQSPHAAHNRGMGGLGASSSPHPETTMPSSMAMTNVMDPTGGMASAAAASGNMLSSSLPHPNPMPAAGGGGGPSGAESVSLGTATQTHEVRMPMLTSTFKPATGCTNASDFIVRCFVARLRSGITVVKHGRSRWCKSRLRVLHVHPDGRSLSWKPALGEPSSGKRPPKLDLTSCKEVRHAWSPDPDNPMFTGTPILRQKCEAANAHKSFALIFPKRTVDITAVTADQCKVLMEGFSALCFRLQVAQNVASSSGNNANANNNANGQGNEKDGKQTNNNNEGDKASTAAATVSLTNSSMVHDSPKRKGNKKMRGFR